MFLATEQIETSRCVHQLLLAKFQTGRVQKYRHQEQEVAGSGGSPRHQGLPDGEEDQLLVGHREDWDGQCTLNYKDSFLKSSMYTTCIFNYTSSV